MQAQVGMVMPKRREVGRGGGRGVVVVFVDDEVDFGRSFLSEHFPSTECQEYALTSWPASYHGPDMTIGTDDCFFLSRR